MNLRSRLSTLIAVRVVVSTLLLGSAILVQISRPGAFPIDPFFFLIGLTYALSVLVPARRCGFVDRHPWIADAQLGVDAFSCPRSFTSPAASPATSRRSTCCRSWPRARVRFRRGALQVAALSVVLYLALVMSQYLEPTAFFPASWQALSPLELPIQRFAQYTVAHQSVRVRRRGAALGVAGREPCDRRARASSARRHRSPTCAPSIKYVIDSMLSGLRHGGHGRAESSRSTARHRRSPVSPPARPSAATSARCCSCPRQFRRTAADARRNAQPSRRSSVPRARWPCAGHRPDGHDALAA